MSFPLNVSFQGGGSFLSAMIPVAHAISDAQKHGHVTIEAVAGSSAGAIAAALLAANADFDALREYSKNGLEGDARRAAGKFFDGISLYQLPYAILKVLWGQELISPKKLESFLETVFTASGVETVIGTEGEGARPLDVADFTHPGRPRLHITRSGLEQGLIEIPVESALLPLLIDSCAIPFVLRGYRGAKQRAYVDGGLCDNLPINCFDLEGDASIIAVSILGSSSSSDGFNLRSFSMGLFSTAINNNVSKSKEVVGKLMTIEERVPFSFQDVSAAVRWIGDDDRYLELYNNAHRRLLDLSGYHTMHHGHGVFINSRDTKLSRDRNLKELLGSLYDDDAFVISKIGLRVNAGSLENPDRNSYKRLDIITTSSRITVAKTSSPFYKSYIPLLDGMFHPVTWKVTNLTKGFAVRFTPFHYHDEADGGDHHDPCFIRFDAMEDEMDVGDEISVECIYAILPSMSDLEGEGREYLSLLNRHDVALPLEIVLIYPTRLGALDFESREKEGKVSDFVLMSEEALGPRLGPDAVGLSAAGVESVGTIDPEIWLSVWVKRRG